MTHLPRSVLHWGRSSSQPVEQPQYFLEQFSRHRDLGHLEDGVAGVAHDLGTYLHKLLPQAGQRPMRDRLGQGQRPHEVGEIGGQRVQLKTRRVGGERAARQALCPATLRAGFITSTIFTKTRLLYATMSRGVPGATVMWQEMNSSEQVEALREGKIDIGFLHTPSEHRDLEAQVIVRDPIVVAVPDTHRLAGRRNAPLSEFGGDDFVLPLRHMSPAFIDLAPDTRKGYQRAFDACKAIDLMPLTSIDQMFILGLQERIYRKRGRWLANMVVSVLSVVMGWGMPRGLTESNAAAGVPKIRRPRSAPVANRAWTEREIDAALGAATRGLRKAIALAYYAGLRKKDVVELLASARADGIIGTTQSKTGHELSIFEARKLTAILDEPDKKPGEWVVVNSLGKPYTRDSLDSVFDQLKRDLVKGKAIRPGLTFHGLRKSLGKRAADAGFSELDIAAALGHSSPASSRPYTVEAARKRGARCVIRALDKK